MDLLIQDIRYAIRQLFRQRGVSIVAILTLALGIGASTAVFTVIDAAMLRPLPYPDPEQLVTLGVEVILPDGQVSRPTPSMEDMRFWQQAEDVFSFVAGWGTAFGGRIVEGPEPERVEVLQITEDFLAMHGVMPVLGRGFNLDDMQVGAPEVALLGYGYWQRRYGGRENVIGESIRLNDGVSTIVGVLPAWFDADTPLFRPLRIPASEAPRRGTGRVSVYGRLRPGVTIEQARSRLSGLAPEPGRDGTFLETRTRVDSRLETTAARAESTVYVLAGAVALILLLACVNVAGLLLARGAARQSELAVRASLGAGPVRLMRQLLTESSILAIAGGVVGVALAWLTLDAIVANIPFRMPDNAPPRVNLSVLIATAGLLIPTVMAFGVVPAIRLARVRIGSTLAQGSRTHAGSSLTRRGGQALIAAEVALAVVLVAGAGLMIRTFSRLAAVDLGFDPEGLITMEVLPLVPDTSAQHSYYASLLEQLRSTPGIGSAGGVDNFALGGRTRFTSVTVDGERTGIILFGTLPGYFETLGAALRQGRLLTELDYVSDQRVAIISETAARAMFAGGPAVGRQFTLSIDPEPWTVLGVVADLRHGGPLGDEARYSTQVYLPFEPRAGDDAQAMLIVVRPSGPVPDLAVQLRRAAQAVGVPVLVESIRPANDWFGDRVATPRRRTILLGLLGGLGLVLALVGVFGMTAYAVGRRTGEIGVRMALGAQRGQVIQTILWDSVAPILIGTVIGLGGAAAATRTIRSFLLETEPTDPVTFAAVALTLIAAGCLAAWIPSLRAARVDPVATLRAD